MNKKKVCIIEGCEDECKSGTRYCKKHYLLRRKEQRLEKIRTGKKFRTTYTKICIVCGKEYQAWRKESSYCSTKCANSMRKKLSSGINPYVRSKNNYFLHEHRIIASKILGRKLKTNEVVHHLDLNPKNNEVTNLIVISRREHPKLHDYINKQGALLEQSNNGNTENCWKTLIVPMTTTWLETTNVKVIKLWEIGQSASEPLE